MTKIPSVEEVANDFGKQFDELKMKPPKNSMPGLERELLKDFMRKALTAEREAGAREERERVHKFVRKDFHSDFVENGLATRFYQALTPPTK